MSSCVSSWRDGRVDSASAGQDVGFAVRVVHDGTWGFAAGVDLTPEAAVAVAEQAVEVAKVSRPVNSEPIELADEPVYADVTWVSPYEVNPFDVPDAEKFALLADWSERLLAAEVREVETQTDIVGFGSCVEVEDGKSGKLQTYTIVSAHEADPTAGTLSIDSPVGRSLVGRKVGDTASIETPRGARSLKVLKITT